MIKQCKYCLSDFKVKPSHFEKRVYCSTICMSNAYTFRLKGENNPNYKAIQNIVKSCKICGSEFSPGSAHATRKICSDPICFAKLISLRTSGVSKTKESIQKRLESFSKKREAKQPDKDCVCGCGNKKHKKSKTCFNCLKKPIVFFKCLSCGNEVKKIYVNQMYCNLQCRSVHRSINSMNENNFNWKGGVKPENQRERNHSTYKFWREQVFKRDGFTCQDCGQIGGALHAHHIKSFSEHKDLRTEISNGKTVCLKCHNKYHPKFHFKRIIKKANPITTL